MFAGSLTSEHVWTPRGCGKLVGYTRLPERADEADRLARSGGITAADQGISRVVKNLFNSYPRVQKEQSLRCFEFTLDGRTFSHGL
jgi:hypothetical protein